MGLCQEILQNISKVIIGKKDTIELLLVALLGEGHVLIEDVPGVGKTLLAKALAKSIGGKFKRVQFTPDLLPSDITGFNVFNQQSGAFEFMPGPVMANVLLADEINRTVPRTQASLLESMEEHQVTIDSTTTALPAPFFVLATQNPIELEGTFPLPEAQLDRFLLKVALGYPNQAEEIAILDNFRQNDPLGLLAAVATPTEIIQLQKTRRQVHVSQAVKKYITAIVHATRKSRFFRFGASPRGSLGLMRASQGLAYVRGRDYVLPDDIKYLALPVLAHRLVLQPAEQLRGESVHGFLEEIIATQPVPTDAS
jgi:MoxR-like ATPase